MRTCWWIIMWASIPSLLAAAGDHDAVIFEENFEDELDESWQWLREVPKAWRIRDGALEIRTQPGDANTVKNALVRKAPARDEATPYAIEVTVTNVSPPTEQWEQLGLTWYSDGKPVLKLVKERIDGATYVFPGKVPIDEASIQLRLVVRGRTVLGQYRTNGEEDYQTAAEAELPPPGAKDEISIQTYHGPSSAEHWMRFDDFRLLNLGE